jgi:hypothetical protein
MQFSSFYYTTVGTIYGGKCLLPYKEKNDVIVKCMVKLWYVFLSATGVFMGKGAISNQAIKSTISPHVTVFPRTGMKLLKKSLKN